MSTPPATNADSWLRALIECGSVPRVQASLSDAELAAMGLTVRDAQLCVPDGFDPVSASAISARLVGEAFDRVVRVEPLMASTNTALLQSVQAGEQAADVLIADYQFDGRGRRGRTWLSPVGHGVAMSVACHLDQGLSESAPLSLVAGIAVVEALEDLGVSDAQLKWPNDVLRGASKVCGILAEVAATDPVCIVVGIGINVGAAGVSPSVDRPAGDLSDVVSSRNQVIAAVLNRLIPAVQGYDRNGFAPFRERWESRHGFQHKPVRIELGEQHVDGIVRGVALDGRLEVATSEGLQRFSAGEVSMRPSPEADG